MYYNSDLNKIQRVSMVSDPALLKISDEAMHLSRVYKKRRDRLLILSLLTILLPALLSTVVAIISGIEFYKELVFARITIGWAFCNPYCNSQDFEM